MNSKITPHRHLPEVIAQVQALAPDLREALESTRTSALYAAPEAMGIWWTQFVGILNEAFFDHPRQKEIRAILDPATTNKTQTPLTDAFLQKEHVAHDGMWVAFARQLETELAAANAKLAALSPTLKEAGLDKP